MKIKIVNEQTMEITPNQLAECFWEMNAFQQRDFFEHLAIIASEEDFRSQMQSAHFYSAKAKNIMKIIANSQA